MGHSAGSLMPIAGTIIGSMFGAPELGALAGMAGSTIMGAGQKAATAGPPPQLATVPTMPAINGPQIAAAQQASVAQQMSRGGRASTILNASPTDTLGG